MNNALLYAAANSLQRRAASAALARHLRHMTWHEENEDVLDVGCGTGEVTSKLLLPSLQRSRSLVGVDISPEMVNFAAANHQQPNLRFHCFDIAQNSRPRATFPNGFHKIFSFFCLNWVLPQRLALGNMYDLLKPGGEIFLLFVAQTSVYTMHERVAMSTEWGKYTQDFMRFVSPYHYCTNPETVLRAHLDDCGFSVKVCECQDYVYDFPTEDEYKKFIMSINPFLNRIPRKHHEAYVKDCMAEIKLLGKSTNDGGITESYRLLHVLASKLK